MKTQTHKNGLLHVETPLGIVNIYVGLFDAKGRNVERVEMIPNRYCGEPKVIRSGSRFIQLKTVKG